jgi:amino acid adenylation domain-containing protein
MSDEHEPGNDMVPDVGHTLHRRFLRGLALSPDRDAVRARGRAITYADAHRQALVWAGNLLRACPERPRAIGVLAAKGVEAYVGILAALYCGVPVVPLQPDFPVARTRHMLTAAGVSAVLTDEAGYRLVPELLGADHAVTVLCLGAAGALDPAAALAAPLPVDPADPAYVLFTSGSTGRPKGVPISHRNLDHFFRVMEARYDFGPDDVFSHTFDLTFDCAMFDIFAAWGAGGTLVSVPAQAYGAMPAFIADEGITVWYSTPTAISVVARRGGLEPGAMPTLRWCMFAGDVLKAADAEAWQRAASNAVVENLYGPTELTITVTAYRWSPRTSPAECLNGVVPIGRVHEGHEFLLLAEHGEHSVVEGEFCVSGPQLTHGYLDPRDDEGRFLDYDSRTWYRTGDRVRLADGGALQFLGRIDGQVQIQGWRIELAEIEHHVRSCAGVADAVVVTTAVEDETRLVVFYTGTPTRPAAFARPLLAALPQGMVPRHYHHLDEMPLNANRKIDRSVLKERAGELFGHVTPVR